MNYSKVEKTIASILIPLIFFGLIVRVPFFNFIWSSLAWERKLYNIVSLLVDENIYSWIRSSVNEYAKKSIEFENNTRIMVSATTEDPFRGDTLNILFCDEFAFVRKNIAEEFWSSNYPTLSASESSKIIVISTPNGLFNLFERLYTILFLF